MIEARRHICLGFSDERYPEGTHICYLYSDDEERRRILPLFARHALLEHEYFAYLADADSAQDLPRVNAELGLARAGHELRGLVDIRTARDGYYPDGSFSPQALLDRLGRIYHESIAAGYSGARITGEMCWSLRGIPGAQRIIECEAGINDLVQQAPITVMCQYDMRKFDGATLFDVMQVHPVIAVGGHIVRNPFYTHPG